MNPRPILMAALVFLGSLIALPSAQAFARSPKVPMDKQLLLKKWLAIPDLLFVAREKAKDGDAYALLKPLEAEYRKERKVFQITTLYRSTEQCKSGEHQFTRSTLTIVNAKGERIETTGLIKHEIEVHHADFPAALADFLKALPDADPAKP